MASSPEQNLTLEIDMANPIPPKRRDLTGVSTVLLESAVAGLRLAIARREAEGSSTTTHKKALADFELEIADRAKQEREAKRVEIASQNLAYPLHVTRLGSGYLFYAMGA